MDEFGSTQAVRSSGISACRGVRGATTVDVKDNDESLAEAVGELLLRILGDNGAVREDVAAVIFTVSEDLAGTNPAAAARAYGFESVPLLVVREHGGDQRVGRCVRVLVLLNTVLGQLDLRHAYLRGAEVLRPDLQPTGTVLL
ncbi:MAG TPA: chorismate mutase [Candidatus Saccharimonadales bacterium]|nr:chorismate mutase [Candidatus Saccharimonadales bacterium]